MANQIFAFGLRQINPAGKSLLIFRNRVKPRNQKYFVSGLTQIRCISRASRPTRGAIARRHERGAGCGGRESVRRATAVAGRDAPRERSASVQDDRRLSGRQNRVVLAPVAGVKFAEASRPNRALDKTLIRG